MSWSVQKQRLGRLLGRPGRAVDPAELLDLVEVVGVLLAGQRVRAVGPELRRARERERPHSGQAQGPAPPRARVATRRGRARAGRGQRRSGSSPGRRSRAARARLRPPSDRPRCRSSFAGPSGDRVHVRDVIAVENRLLGGAQAKRGQADERVVRRGRDRRLGGSIRRAERDRVRLIAALDRHRGVVDGDVDDAHVHGRLTRELVAEVLRTEAPARAGRHDRAPCLGAPEGDRCRRGRVAGGRRALGGRRSRPDTRPGADQDDRPERTARRPMLDFIATPFVTGSPRRREAARARARCATSAASRLDEASNVKKQISSSGT